MKILQILEREQALEKGPVSEDDQQKIANVIHRIEGNLILQQIHHKEIIMEGDHFENISQSIIATRGAIAKGIIGVRESGREGIADALEHLVDAVSNAPLNELDNNKKAEALELIEEISSAGGAVSEGKKVTVLKAIGTSLKTILNGVKSVSEVFTSVWPVIEKLWEY